MLSFERIQLILGLPKFKESTSGIDALQGAIKEHSRYVPNSSWKCKLDHRNSFPRPEVTYHLKYISNPSYEPDFPKLGGLRLSIDMSMKFYSAEKEGRTRETILRFLGNMGNAFACPHRKFGDLWIVDKIFKVSNPHETSTDPVEEWLAREEAAKGKNQKPFILVCDHCTTMIKIGGSEDYPRVSVTRCLGKGESADDHMWLAQSVV